MTNAPSPANDDTLVEVAAHWCMRMHATDCTDEERAQFKLWLEQDLSHPQEYVAMLEIWELSEQLPSSTPAPNARPVLRQAPPPPSLPVTPRRRRGFSAKARAIALAVVVTPFALYGGWMLGWLPNSYEHFENEQNISRI